MTSRFGDWAKLKTQLQNKEVDRKSNPKQQRLDDYGS